MIVCVLLPRFTLAVAAGGREVLASGPVALAPESGREQLIGEVSAAAEAYGLRAGLRLGEALARCPTLRLVAPDPAGVADAWDAHVRALEDIGAAVEVGPPGIAWFGAGGLKTLHGGTLDGVLEATRRALRGHAPAPLVPARIGAAPSRFAAYAAAGRSRARRSEVAPLSAAALAAYMAPLPVSLLLSRPEVAMLPDALERFGIATLGGLAKLPRAALADRFGPPGPLARDLAQGKDTPLVPRTATERLEERLDLPESASGVQLQRGMELLIDRLLARRERRGRALRAVVLSARLIEGGTWRAHVTFREPLADPAPDAARARPEADPSCRRPPTRCACAPRASARPRATSARCSPSRRRSAAPACARRSARPAPSRARTPRCASSRSIPSRACRSGGSRWRRGIREARWPRRARSRCGWGRAAARRRWASAWSRPCASPGWSRTAGGRTRRAAAVLGGGHGGRAGRGRVPRSRGRGVVCAAVRSRRAPAARHPPTAATPPSPHTTATAATAPPPPPSPPA